MSNQEHSIHKTIPTQTEIDECEARCDALFKQKQQELEAVKALYKKLLNESKKQVKICDDCCEELYWSEKRESELCPNCDIDESDDEEEDCCDCHETGELCPETGGKLMECSACGPGIVEEELNQNGFQLYDIDNQPLELLLNYETFQEIEDDIQRHIDEYPSCLKATSVIIEFNGLVLTFNIKAHNDTLEYGDYDLEFVRCEDV